MRVSTWDEEVEIRLGALRCSVCGGVNPYVCECAEKAFLKQQKQKKPRLALSEDRIEREWANYKELVCSPSTIICKKCKTGEWETFCRCGKAEWLAWFEKKEEKESKKRI